MIRAAIYGRLGADPVKRETRNGAAMATASLAVNAARPDQSELTEWIGIVAFGALAGDLLREAKGAPLAAIGMLAKRSWTDAEGVQRETWSLTAEAIISAHSVRPGGGRRRKTAARKRQQAKPPEGSTVDPDLNDDLPI